MRHLSKLFSLLCVVVMLVLVAEVPAHAQPTEPVDFDRTCMDAEDGDISASMVWTSDLDGELGQGGQFITGLTEGLHTITITCVDSEGLSPTPLVITYTVAIGNTSPVFAGAAGGGEGLPVDGGCAGSDCP